MADSKKMLHILKTEPDQLQTDLMDMLSKGNEVKQVVLYDASADYEALVDLIFESDQVITWW